jgi:hypothetical protein
MRTWKSTALTPSKVDGPGTMENTSGRLVLGGGWTVTATEAPLLVVERSATPGALAWAETVKGAAGIQRVELHRDRRRVFGLDRRSLAAELAGAERRAAAEAVVPADRRCPR